jgi:hypothetical protein
MKTDKEDKRKEEKEELLERIRVKQLIEDGSYTTFEDGVSETKVISKMGVSLQMTGFSEVQRREMEENETRAITINHPKIVDFLKDKTPDEIDEIMVTFIDFSKKCMKVCTSNNSTMTHNHYEKGGKIAVENCLKTGMTEDEKTEVIKINKYVLHEINKEYQEFVRNKDALIGVLKENGKHSFSLVNGMKMPYLEKYICETCDTELSTKLQVVNQFKCDVCNYYICNTKKALSAHQRGCKRNMVNL